MFKLFNVPVVSFPKSVALILKRSIIWFALVCVFPPVGGNLSITLNPVIERRSCMLFEVLFMKFFSDFFVSSKFVLFIG